MSSKPKRSVRHAIAESERVTTHQLRQDSRTARERRQSRRIILAVAAAVLLIALVPAFGYWREVLAKGDQPVAEVNGRAISTETYAKTLGFNQLLVRAQAGSLQSQLGELSKEQSGQTAVQRQLVQQQLASLQQQANALDGLTLDDLVEGQLIRDEAARRGITVDQAAMDDALRRSLGASSGGLIPLLVTDTITGTAGFTGTGQVSIEQAQKMLADILGRASFLSPAEYRTLVQDPIALRDKLRQAFASEAPTSAEQVRARHILVDTQEQASAVIERLKAGEDIAKLAAELSKDIVTKDKGGELGWFPRGIMVKEFEDAAFGLPPGQLSDPIRSSFGYHVIEVEEGPAVGEIKPEFLEQLKARLFDQWLSSQKKLDSPVVKYTYSPDKADWARRYISERLARQ